MFLILNKRFYYSYIAYDEGFFVWGGWSITKGLAPYRDFIEFKPPLVFITHALAQLLFGFKDGGYRKFFTLFPLGSLLALQLSLVVRRVGRVLAMSLVLGDHHPVREPDLARHRAQRLRVDRPLLFRARPRPACSGRGGTSRSRPRWAASS